MTPEKGDPDIRVERADISRAYRRVGAVSGDIVVMHGSLSSMGSVCGGPTTVLDGILDAIGPGGTLCVPTLWYHGKPPVQKPENFDPDSSPAYNGALAEAMRQDPRSLRSDHFSHSVSAIGAKAEELTAGHGASGPAPSPWCEKAFAEQSPWAEFYRRDALYTFIGVDMTVCTMKHYVESRYALWLLGKAPPHERAALRNQLSKDLVVRAWPFYYSGPMGDLLESRGLVARTRIGSATLRAIRTRPLVETSLQILKNSPLDWLREDFIDWLRSAPQWDWCGVL